MSRPSTRAVPAVGCRNPSSSRMNVLLPAPFGPRNPNTSPARTSSVTSLSAAITAPRRPQPAAVVLGQPAGRDRGRRRWRGHAARLRPEPVRRTRRPAARPISEAAPSRYDRPDAVSRGSLAPRHRRLHVVGQDRRAAAPPAPRRDRPPPDPARPPRRRRPDARRVRGEPEQGALSVGAGPARRAGRDPVARARARRRSGGHRGGAVLRRQPRPDRRDAAPERPPRHRERPQHRLRRPPVRPDAGAARPRRRDHDAQRDLRGLRRDGDPDPAPRRRPARRRSTTRSS